jgi:hypothetical protein
VLSGLASAADHSGSLGERFAQRNGASALDELNQDRSALNLRLAADGVAVGGDPIVVDRFNVKSLSGLLVEPRQQELLTREIQKVSGMRRSRCMHASVFAPLRNPGVKM